MSTHVDKINERNTANPWPAMAAAGAGLSAILTAMGTFWDLTDNESGEPGGFSEYLIVIGIIAVATVVVFGLVARGATPANAGRRSLALAVVGLLSIAVFWAGLPAVLAAGATACALVDRTSGRLGRMSQAAVAISVITVGLAVWLAIAG